MQRAFSLVFTVVVSFSSLSSAFASVTGLQAFARNGQTFLTWDLVIGDGVTYRVYRCDSLISSGQDLLPERLLWEVNDSSVINVRKTAALDSLYTYCIEDLVPLPLERGLYVYTATREGSAYYAVTSVQDGAEDTSIVVGEGGNALDAPLFDQVKIPEPVLQFEGIEYPGIPIRDYVHWGTNVDTDSVQAMANVPSHPFNFRVWNAADDSSTHVLRIFLHAAQGFFTTPGRMTGEGTILLTPDCPRDSYPLAYLGKSYWFGYNSNFGLEEPLTEGTNVNYHERRLLYLKDWAVKYLNIDPQAVHVTGGSYGGIGTVIMAMAHPEEFASVIASLPKLDLGDTAYLDFPWLTSILGSPDEHILTSDSIDTYDRLDASWMIEHFRGKDFPILTMFFGKYDTTLGWPEKIEFMHKSQEMRIGGSYFWDTSTHGQGGISEWSSEFVHRLKTFSRYRRDQSYPAVSNLSINDDPGNGDPDVGDSVGTFGGYVDWIPETIVDEPQRYEVSIGLTTSDSAIVLPADTATAVITLRRLQHFLVDRDSLYYFVNLDTAANRVVQTAFIRPDSLPLLSVEDVRLSTHGHRLSFSPASGYLHSHQAEPQDSILPGMQRSRVH